MVGMTVAVAVSVEEAAKISCCGFFLLRIQAFHLEVLVVEAVEQEVSKIRNNCFGSFLFQKIYQVVVGCGRNLTRISPTTPTRGFFISSNSMIVKIFNDLTAETFEFTSAWIAV